MAKRKAATAAAVPAAPEARQAAFAALAEGTAVPPEAAWSSANQAAVAT